MGGVRQAFMDMIGRQINYGTTSPLLLGHLDFWDRSLHQPNTNGLRNSSHQASAGRLGRIG